MTVKLTMVAIPIMNPLTIMFSKLKYLGHS